MTSIGWLFLLAFLFTSCVAAAATWKWRSAERSYKRVVDQVNGWRNDERLLREVRWSPEFIASGTSSEFGIDLVRVAVFGNGRRTLNRLSVGAVETSEEGWEQRLDALVVSARARMAELNAFIDSYSDAS